MTTKQEPRTEAIIFRVRKSTRKQIDTFCKGEGIKISMGCCRLIEEALSAIERNRIQNPSKDTQSSAAAA